MADGITVSEQRMSTAVSRTYQRSLVMLRRDLRIEDHEALAQACRVSQAVHLLFVFDRAILDELPDRADRRVEFIWESLKSLERLPSLSGSLVTAHAKASDAVPAIALALGVEAVFFNHDDEPYALTRDRQLVNELKVRQIDSYSFKDHVIFERSEVLTQAGKPYSVFTPYKQSWLKRLAAMQSAVAEAKVDHSRLKAPDELQQKACLELAQAKGWGLWFGTAPDLDAIGFEATNLSQLRVPISSSGAQMLLADFAARMDRYDKARDFPALKGPSYLSVHFRFGTISIRQAVRLANQHSNAGAQTWLSELIWRDFYMQILYHFPHVARQSFKPEYDLITWEKGPKATADFKAWCDGQTGYPLVDAAMRQLLQSGYMHNRLRMVTASFLCKDLGLDWRWGEAWFARHLLDFDLAANNGGWQWAASSGCDAQPYFRIFNPVSQSQKFDREARFIRRYVPELARLTDQQVHAPWEIGGLDTQAIGFKLGRNYPMPIVDHDQARKKTLERYQVVKRAKSETETEPKA
ncbi:MAG: cryptochrome/photolyase family protein [Betaproteobacteria bacterium]